MLKSELGIAGKYKEVSQKINKIAWLWRKAEEAHGKHG
jgi:hypothetical protein